MNHPLDQDWEYQLHDDKLLAAIPEEEWIRAVEADTERIRRIHREQAEILRRQWRERRRVA